MSKKTLILVVSLVLSLAVGLGGSLAYLTDRDAKTNIFTVGNVDISLDEEFEQGAELMPGVNVPKIPTITNEGDNDTYVWMTIAVPTSVENADASQNVIHWNWLAGTCGYDNTKTPSLTEAKLNTYIENGWLPEGFDMAAVNENGDYWYGSGNEENAYSYLGVQDINGETCNVYVFKYANPLTAGEETVPGPLVNVYMDKNVDIDPDGNMFRVVNGVATDLGWNVKENGFPKIYVAAYGIQAEGFENVDAAYEAYMGQWGENGGVEYAASVSAKNSEELAKAIEEAAGKSAIIMLPAGEFETNFEIEGGSDITIIGEGENTVLSGQIASTTSKAGTLTLSNLTYKVDDTIQDSTGISQTGKSAIALWGNQKVVCTNVTFEMSLTDSTAITAWWDTHEGTSITVKDCTFNCNGQRPIRATGNVTVENTTFNDPYRYAVQLTAKASTATELDKAIINFNNNTIINGENGKAFVYGLQLEGADYGCNNCVINGAGNTIENGGADSYMYYCECGMVDHETIEWNVEETPVHEG
ncbi:MAG: hypothetical protein IJB81_06005 [Clostridia bacterium]|nr:hypothetical protein [Clostridia bacterium]